MYVIKVKCPPYVAAYLQKEFRVVDGAVVLPQWSLAWNAIVNGTVLRPITAAPHEGNIEVGIMSGAVRFKNLDKQNWLSENKLNYISKLLRWQFDAALIEYMEKRYFRNGLTYEDAMREFMWAYDLEGLIGEEALLKKHGRWKERKRDYKRQMHQTELF